MFSLSYWARFYFADSRGNSWIFTAQLAWALDFPCRHSRDRAGFVLHICAQPNGLANEGLIRGHHFKLPLAPLLARARAPSPSRLGVEELERVREERPRDKRPHTPAPKSMHTAECCGGGQSPAASSRVFCRSALRA